MKTFKQHLHEQTYKYSCMMAQVPDWMSERIDMWAGEYINPYDIEDEEEKGLEEDHHVTIKWGLYPQNYQDVLHLIGGIRPFRVDIKGISVFDNPDSCVLKLDVESKILRKLHLRFKNSLPNIETYPEYRPHVTICYLKAGCNYSKYLTDISRDIGMHFMVTNLSFCNCEGHTTTIPLIED